ncbi:S8 family peptidase [Haloplanus natans]|uniref:S8 family peptidase n=1 Tax=Haloplanus natans TaxID=376171 RepID=UPI000A769E2D|nr:S8 family peptidase [Haloplanus natans]
MGSEAPEGQGSDSGDDSTGDSTGIGSTTRRGVLVGLTTGAGIGLGAAAAARGPPAHAGNDAGTGRGNNGRAPAGNDDTPGRGPPDQVIVGTTTQAAADEAARQAREVRHKLDFGDHGKAVAGRFPEPARKGLANRPDVRYVEPDATFEAVAQSTPWGVDRVDADTVHGDGTTGSGADIAIIDTGIDSDHPDLVDNLGSGTAYVEAGTDYDGSSCSGNGNTYYEPWDDDNDHGTHCAGIAAGVDNGEGVVGVAPGATLHAVKVLACSGTGYLSDIAAGVEYTANQGWDVASMSLGSSSSYSTLRDACQYAVDQGVLLVAAAGNDGPCSDCVSYPATYDSVVAVSATTSADDLASFSSTGPEIDIAAPGSSILSTVPGGEAYFSGTSMACPHVSGVGGLLMANGYTGSEARSALQGSAEDIGLSSSDGGNGLLDANGAAGDLQNMIGEAGTISVDENWTTVTLEGSYTDPVVVTSVGTFNDPDPVHARVRNAGSGSFEVRLEEWEYQDGAHSAESVQYIVVEAGEHDTEAGVPLVAGKTTANGGGWTTVTFTSSWNPQSHVYTQVMSNNDSTPVSTRITRAGAETFDVSCHEEETNESGSSWTNDHADETVGFIATQPQSRIDNAGAGESIASSIPTDAWTTNPFQESYSAAPVTVPRMQSFFGGNTTDLRMRNLSASSFDVQAQEEQSLDDEVAHVPEYVATLALEAGPTSPA